MDKTIKLLFAFFILSCSVLFFLFSLKYSKDKFFDSMSKLSSYNLLFDPLNQNTQSTTILHTTLQGNIEQISHEGEIYILKINSNGIINDYNIDPNIYNSIEIFLKMCAKNQLCPSFKDLNFIELADNDNFAVNTANFDSIQTGDEVQIISAINQNTNDLDNKLIILINRYE